MKNVVSYGGGTQSTAMILMALNGDYGLQRPDFGVYADTGCEPNFINYYVQYFIEFVKKEYDFDIFTVTKNKGLENKILQTPRLSNNGEFYINSVPPFYILKPDGSVGMLKRQCTADFKTNPLKKLINSKLQRGEKYIKWIGMSFDERSRMRISTEKKVTLSYPLVEKFIYRKHSIDYVIHKGLRKPQRSSCYFCPFHSDGYWLWLRKYHLDVFKMACEFERKIQDICKMANFYGIPFLHSSCKPLSEVKFTNENQLNMFPHLIDECAGECGI